jgi:signal peptidase I
MREKVKERRPVVAALLSLVLMGLGQLYNGQLRRAVVFFAIEILGFGAVTTISTFLLSFHGLIIIYFGALIFVGIRIFAVIDAFIGARRIGEAELQRYNRWYVYVPIFLGTIIILMVFETPVASYSIPSGSTQPTLLIGDSVFVDKNAYHDRAPERGDVAVFRLPRNTSVDFIKRIVGLPGDRIQVVGGVLHINGEPVPRERIEDFVQQGVSGNSRRVAQYVETLPNGVSYRVIDERPQSSLDNTIEYVVPEGHYFTMGDNRDNSLDSRGSVGFVPVENLIGRAEIVYFSQNGSASWWQIWRWSQAIRFGRIGNGID